MSSEEELDDEHANDTVDLSIEEAEVLEDDEEDDEVTEAQILNDDENGVDSDDEPLLKKIKTDKKAPKTSLKKIEPHQEMASLNIPVRVTKRIMNLCPCPESMVISMEAAVVMTSAAEMFVQQMAHWSYENSQKRQRNSVR
jgi:histone H3/H4